MFQEQLMFKNLRLSTNGSVTVQRRLWAAQASVKTRIQTY